MNIGLYRIKWQELLWVVVLAALGGAATFLRTHTLPGDGVDWTPFLSALGVAVGRPVLAALWNLFVKVGPGETEPEPAA